MEKELREGGNALGKQNMQDFCKHSSEIFYLKECREMENII